MKCKEKPCSNHFWPYSKLPSKRPDSGNLTDYECSMPCPTPYCGGTEERHCKVCGWYIVREPCDCHSIIPDAHKISYQRRETAHRKQLKRYEQERKRKQRDKTRQSEDTVFTPLFGNLPRGKSRNFSYKNLDELEMEQADLIAK